MSSAWLVMHSTGVGAGSNGPSTATAAATATRPTRPTDLAHRRRPLTDKQATRLRKLFDADEHDEATWGIYQRMVAAYRERHRRHGKELVVKPLIDSVTDGVPAALTEVITLGRTLKKRTAGVLTYFDPPGTCSGPAEAINGRLEHLRGSALGFRNLTNYIARCLLESRGFKLQLRPRL